MTADVTTIIDAEVEGERVDVRITGDRISAVAPSLDRSGARVVDAGGGALIAGLHDHHVHLLSLAAAGTSIDIGASAATFDRAVRGAPGTGWLRVVGYDDIHGPLDRDRLDRLAPGRPVRVQHRSGAMWVVSSAGLRELGIESDDGRLHRLDHVIAERLPMDAPPDLAPIGAQLARFGVTSVTDATPYEDRGAFEILAAARRSGALPQKVTVTGGPGLAAEQSPSGLARGPVKVVVADNALPSLDELVAAYRAARAAGMPVAVHCVTVVGLVLALAAWDEVGAVAGDRIEHGSVIPVELIGRIRDLGLTVVTQPGFVFERGDHYLTDVPSDEQPSLYRCKSLLAAGIPVLGSTDAPFGPVDPWLAIRTAIERRTASGSALGSHEAVDACRALELFSGPLGSAADLCLLHVPRAAALREPSAALVRATWIGGRLVYRD